MTEKTNIFALHSWCEMLLFILYQELTMWKVFPVISLIYLVKIKAASWCWECRYHCWNHMGQSRAVLYLIYRHKDIQTYCHLPFFFVNIGFTCSCTWIQCDPFVFDSSKENIKTDFTSESTVLSFQPRQSLHEVLTKTVCSTICCVHWH